MTPAQERCLLRRPYRITGRDASGIDCLGVVLQILEWHGKTVIDPWRNLVKAYKDNAIHDRHAFGPDWSRVHDGTLQSLDILLYHEAHSWSAIISDAYVWSAHPQAGVWRRPLHQLHKRPNEVWRQTC